MVTATSLGAQLDPPEAMADADVARWCIRIDDVPTDALRTWESITALSDGHFGVRGLGEGLGSPSWAATFADEVFDADAGLMAGPVWTDVHLDPADGWRCAVEIDLSTAELRVTYEREPSVRVAVRRWLPSGHPGLGIQQVAGPRRVLGDDHRLRRPRPGRAPADSITIDRREFASGESMRVADPVAGTDIEVVLVDDESRSAGDRHIDRLVAFAASGTSGLSDPASRLRGIASRGLDGVRLLHRAGWRDRWRGCGTRFDHEPDLERAVRFATFHLLQMSPSPDMPGGAERQGRVEESAIGARGLTGTAYRGHVFWDTDVFVVPALSAIAPRGAALALNYRSNRLGQARGNASREGRRGARYPWESAREGDDVTPSSVVDLNGRRIPVLTGDLELHVTADVAWAVRNHHRWTGDDRWFRRHGAPIILETARYWADRIEIDDDGSAHVRHVIGPDEYHDDVDDNAFTNVMARHNLRIAADIAPGAAPPMTAATDDERARWRALADALVDGFDPTTGVYAQFDGFHDLDATPVASIGEPPLSVDVLLGRERTASTQISKQPDVLMAYHLVPEEMEGPAFETNLRHYLPLTASGSSLAPAICASLLFRAGDLDSGLRWFELAAALDLDDRTRTTAGGLHVATMGGLWQAVTIGLFGIRERDGGLTLDPHIPPSFGAVTHRFRFRNHVVTTFADGDAADIEATGDITLHVGGESRTESRQRLIRRHDQWEHR